MISRDRPLFPSLDDFDVLVRRVRNLEDHIRLSESQGGAIDAARAGSVNGTGLDGTSSAVPFPDIPAGIDTELQQRTTPFDYLPVTSTGLAEGRRLLSEEERLDMQRQPTREASPDMTNYNDSMALEVRFP